MPEAEDAAVAPVVFPLGIEQGFDMVRRLNEAVLLMA